MQIVVSDTSPIRALGHLERLDLLRDHFDEVLIPQEVLAELVRTGHRHLAIAASNLAFTRVVEPQRIVEIPPDIKPLHSGELHALSVAVELGIHNVLIDEKRGRGAAVRLGLRPLGVLGLLLRAKQKGLIRSLRPHLDRLQTELQFFISPHLREHFLELADERDMA